MDNSIRTDLALEARELNAGLRGVTEEIEQKGSISISRIDIVDEIAAKQLGKQPGRYITLDAPELVQRPLSLFRRLGAQLADELRLLLPRLDENSTVLVVGLGNRSITPDSLGPRVVEQVFVTRHIRQHMPDSFEGSVCSVCAFSPGVLGVTGVETLEVVRGVKEHVQPDVMLIIDALASRRAARISTTLQLTNTGISPGSGVGNRRAGLSERELGVPTIAIGVPLVVHAQTISFDTIELIASQLGYQADKQRMLELARQVMDEHIGPLVVTPKDIDSIVEDMSAVVADGINIALFNGSYNEVRELVT